MGSDECCPSFKRMRVPVSKVVEEFPLSACSQTHEMAQVGEEMLLVSQQPDSCVVKVKLEAGTGQPLEAKKFQLGSSHWAGLHGLYASKRQRGLVWATLQFESALLLLDPVAADVQEPPRVVKRIELPKGVRWGPHTLVEDPFTQDLWVACKGSSYVLRVNPDQPSDYTTYPCSPYPIFMAVHSTSGDVYGSLHLSNKIFRPPRPFLHAVDTAPSTAVVVKPPPASIASCFPSPPPQEIDIPPSMGNTPVGLLAGPDGNVWFVLLGNSTGGTGRFARIAADGSITWFQLPSTPAGAVSRAGLIHLAFEADTYPNNITTALLNKPPLRLSLLGSSMASSNCINAVFSVTIDGDNPTRISSVDTLLMPTPSCLNHRILYFQAGRSTPLLFVTELGVSVLARVTGGALWSEEVPSETRDSYALWGCGCDADYIKYVRPSSTNQDEDDQLNAQQESAMLGAGALASKKRRTTAITK